jgi:hypothetical protein
LAASRKASRDALTDCQGANARQAANLEVKAASLRQALGACIASAKPWRGVEPVTRVMSPGRAGLQRYGKTGASDTASRFHADAPHLDRRGGDVEGEGSHGGQRAGCEGAGGAAADREGHSRYHRRHIPSKGATGASGPSARPASPTPPRKPKHENIACLFLGPLGPSKHELTVAERSGRCVWGGRCARCSSTWRRRWRRGRRRRLPVSVRRPR